MDPDKTLATALEAARLELDGAFAHRGRAEALAEAVLALDEWLAKGGYLPARWRAAWDTAARQQLEARGREAEEDHVRQLREEAGRLRAAGDLEGARDAQELARRKQDWLAAQEGA